jgi:hypothetical protein
MDLLCKNKAAVSIIHERYPASNRRDEQKITFYLIIDRVPGQKTPGFAGVLAFRLCK